jgi:hypothetical protein
MKKLVFLFGIAIMGAAIFTQTVSAQEQPDSPSVGPSVPVFMEASSGIEIAQAFPKLYTVDASGVIGNSRITETYSIQAENSWHAREEALRRFRSVYPKAGNVQANVR